MPSKPKLAVLTIMSRTQYLKEMVASVQNLHNWFDLDWRVSLSPADGCLGTWGDRMNDLVRPIYPDTWCVDVDDDTIVHPEFGERFSALVRSDSDHLLEFVLFKQYNRDGHPRACVQNPQQMRYGTVDLGQFGFRARVVHKYPFPPLTTNPAPDGKWAEIIQKELGERPYFPEIPVLYNALRETTK